MATERKTSDNQNNERGGFDPRGHQLCAPAPADSAPLQDAEAHDDQNSYHFYVSGEHGKKIAAVFGDHNTDRGRGAACREPVAPSNDESRIFADGPAREIVLPTAAAMPNHMPSTCSKFPRPRVAPAVTPSVLVEDSAEVLDNVESL